MKDFICIIVPCYNPPKNWDAIVRQSFKKIVNELPDGNLQLVLVNDGSTNTYESEIESLQTEFGDKFQYIEYKNNKGKGHAIRKGVSSIKADYYIYTDIDFPYETQDISGIINHMNSGIDVVVGVRSEEYYESLPFFRVCISRATKFLLKHVLLLKIPDTQCGLKGFKSNIKGVFLDTKINRFLFDMEFILIAGKDSNITMYPYPVTLRKGVVFSTLNLRILVREAINFMKLYYLK